MSSLILPDNYRAQGRPVLNLARYHRRFEHGDIIAFTTWHGPDLEECLVLVPTAHFGLNQDYIPAVFLISNISTYAEGWLGADPDQVNAEMEITALGLRLDPDSRTVRRIRGIVADHIEDVLQMPYSRPRENEEVRAIAIQTDRATGKTTETEIRDDV